MAADQPKPTAPPVKRPPAGYRPRLQHPPHAQNADPFVSPRLGLSPNSSFIPSVPGQGWQWPSRSQPGPARGPAPPRSQQMSAVSRKPPVPAQPAQIHSHPKWALPVPHQLLPPNIRVTKFVVYLRGRTNLRVYPCPVVEVFPPRFEPARSAQAIAEQILCLCDIKTILRCQRVCEQFNSTIRRSRSLQRRLWLTDTHEPVPYPDNPNYVDPIIAGLRNELDLLFDCPPGSQFKKILYAPSGVPIKLKDTAESSWRRMLVMRTSERGRYWQIVIAGMGVINLGVLPSSPTFGQVMHAITDVLVYGGKNYRVVASQPVQK